MACEVKVLAHATNINDKHTFDTRYQTRCHKAYTKYQIPVETPTNIDHLHIPDTGNLTQIPDR